jgi:DNA repair protein RadC
VFADPLTDRASAIIVAHNHPSGKLDPSEEDIELTRQLQESGKTLGISLLDHIIFNQKGFWSIGYCEPCGSFS